MKVLKFGGSSIGSAEQIIQVKKIIDSQEESCIIVFSAFQNITDKLIILARSAKQKDNSYIDNLRIIGNYHLDIVKNLIGKNSQEEVIAKVNQILGELENIIKGIFLLSELTPGTLDLVLSFGERLSAFILSNYIENAQLYDAREFIRTNSNFGSAGVDFDITGTLILQKFNTIDKTPVVPGFIASSDSGLTTTLGRGGSDYTAAIIAGILNASVLELWTDVDGFMTADPRKVSKAFAIDYLTYAEAIELSHFGAKVIYTPTIHPVYKKNIPVLIKNSFNPAAKGTIISNKKTHDDKTLIKGISSIEDVSLISVQGTGMVGVTGISMRIFKALAINKINVILITQASSEFSICIAVVPSESEIARKAIEEEFHYEVFTRHEIKVTVQNNLSIIAVVGEQMKNTPGVSAIIFKSLYHNGINVIATAQGSSELNISIVIKKDNLLKALNTIHEDLFLSGYKELNVFLVGTGVVGSALLKQIQKQQVVLLETRELKVNVVGIANIDKMIFNTEGINLNTWKQTLEKEGTLINLDLFSSRIKELNLRNSVYVDCTADSAPASHYLDLINSFVSVVTPNKIACSSNFKHYKQLKDTALKRGIKFLYETNVGAGLPIINTINDLVMSGDKILKIEAVLSGTLNFIFNNISSEIPLSKTIQLAKEKGYSEPDPRIDLSGIDVVRKILILARESGYNLEKEQINVITFLPKDCFDGSLDDFWKKVKLHDDEFEKRRLELEKQGKRWRFVACFENCQATVQLVELDVNHPAYVLEGSNNIIILTTERYKELPMVIKGYGAGAEVTAAGVFSDIIRVANV
jgi:aspartokinase/homoserine dehydrogenase 1